MTVAGTTGRSPIATEAAELAAYKLLETLRWGSGPGECPHCGATGRCYFLRPADGVARATRTGRPSVRRVWSCGSCRRQFSVLTGTVFEGTKTDLAAWVGLVAARAAGRNGQPVTALARSLGVLPSTLRQMIARLDAADAAQRALGTAQVLGDSHGWPRLSGGV